jgi:sulfite exporter TauE/SafE
MDAALLLAMALLGVVSSVHCAGMCGGIVAAFSARRVIPIVPAAAPARPQWLRIALFNGGRITTYAIAGAIAGTVGAGAYAASALPAQSALYFAANLVLVIAGLQLFGAGRWLSRLEALGAPLWRRLQPLATRFIRSDNSYAAGILWGWLPCAFVYGALAAAALAGSPARGAAAMLAFGIGTLPALVAAGLAATQARAWLGRRAVRTAAGSALLGLGTYGLVHAGGVADGVRQAFLCF